MPSSEYKVYLRKKRINIILIHITQIIILLFLIFIWEYLSNKNIINAFIYSSPSRIIKTITDLYKSNNLFNHIWVTTYETIISFSLATILGTFIAILLWYSKFLYKVMDPYLTVLNSLPKVALGPIIIILFGANIKSIIIMALLISLIITIVNVYTGFINTDKNMIKLMESFHASKGQILKFLIVGGLAFVVDYVILIFSKEILKLPILVSSGLAFSLSVIFNYILSIKWVFDVNENNSKKKNFVIFIVLSIIGLVITEIIMEVGCNYFKIYYLLVKIIATAIVMIFNFITRKVFLEK